MAIKFPTQKTAQPSAPKTIYKFAATTPTQASKVIGSNAYEPEDEYLQYYFGGARDIGAIIPPYNLHKLDSLCQENNALNPCIEAMVTNVDGTGFDIVKDDGDDAEVAAEAPDDPQIQEMWDFFNEPWPGESFVTQRKNLRRDIKRTGNAYLEIIRNAKDDIVFSKNVESVMMRLLRLDDPQVQTMQVRRKGVNVTMKMRVRYRRFVQLLNGIQLRYFKEFGCPLDLDKDTGKWAPEGTRLPVAKRATEILHFIDIPDTRTPYGLPCWINELPSVIGSRQAEEFNLGYFDSGGVPPVLILLQGGVLSVESRKAVEQRLVFGPASSKNRVQVLEMEPSGGSLDSPATGKITVERFGSERQNDSMFEKYDDKCEVRVRRGFRLPPIFVGSAADYSFATAFASYTVAEAQVFRPERAEFDEIISLKLVRALGYEGYKIKSRPLNIEDATLRLQGLEIAQTTQQVDAAVILNEINEAVGTRLKVSSTLPVPQTLIPGPTVSAAPGSYQAAPGGKMGINVPKKPTAGAKPQTGTGNTAAKAPKPTPVKQPAVSKEDEDLPTMLARILKTRDTSDLSYFLDQSSKLDQDEKAELLAEANDLLLMADIAAT